MNEATILPSRPRTRLRPTLGMLMALVLLVAGALAWVANRARVQRDAVAAILRKIPSASVEYDWQVPMPRGTRPEAMPKPRGPKWLRDALGPDVFDTATSAYVLDPDDDTMGHVAKLDGLKTLVISGPSAGLSPRGQSAISALGRLETLNLRSVDLPAGFARNLVGAPLLKTLIAFRYAPTDDDMATLASLADLESLDLDGRKVTDAGFAHLAKLTKLKRLSLHGSRISTLAPLANLAGLEILDCPAPAPDGRAWPRLTSLSPITGLANLKTLGLGGHPIDEPGYAGIERLTALLHLTPGDRPTDATLARIATLPKLDSLALSGNRFTAEGLAKVATCQALTFLSLPRTEVRDPWPLAPMVGRLEELRVGRGPLTDDGLRVLASATRLRTLRLTGSAVTGAGLSRLAGATSLGALSLTDTPIDDAGLDALAPLTGLKSLALMRTRITDAGIPSLVALTGLRDLTIRDAPITDAAIPWLAKLTWCRTLTLSGTQLTRGGIDRLRTALGPTLLVAPSPPR